MRRAFALLVRLLAWLAPRRDRDRWREEWLAEIAHIARDRGSLVAARVALGAVPDAFALRRLAREHRPSATARRGGALSSTDLKLACRMLVRHPGLTAVSVLGMAVGIGIAAAGLTMVATLTNPALPFDEGDRVVSIGLWNAQTNNQEQRVLHELASWRTLQSVTDVGAFRTVTRNLMVAGTSVEPVSVAEITASAFRVTRVSPHLGRPLLSADEASGAPDVVVIGDDVWLRRFGADPQIVGRVIQLGRKRYTVVGVMPPAYRFPVAHSFWIPLRVAASYEPLGGPPVMVFGRLTPGATLDNARAEVAAIGRRMSAAFPRTHEYLRARVFPYTHVFSDMDDPDGPLVMRVIQWTLILLLGLVSLNVAILVYARTATRQGEIAVRSALGASRIRIVSQLFVEALVLAGVAALAALALIGIGFSRLDRALQQLAVNFPFWIRFDLTTETVVFIVALTILAAAIVGIVPALKATGRRVQSGLRGISSGAGSGMQMGRTWTILIVAQVAVTVAVLPTTLYQAWTTLRFHAAAMGFAADEFLTADVTMEPPTDVAPADPAERSFRERYAHRIDALERRLGTEPSVSDVTFSLVPPGGELAGIIEVEGASVPAGPINYNIVEGAHQGHLVRFNRVASDFFDAFEVPILMGRSFVPADVGAHGTGVLVDRTFVDRLFGGRSPLGKRLRYVGRSREAGEGNIALDRWYEIVGVVNDFPAHAAGGDLPDPRVYHAASAADAYPLSLEVRVRVGAPSAFADRLREVAARVDPGLQVHGAASAEDVNRREQSLMQLIGVTLVAVIGSVVALSAAGIYALMSFTVARRRKEIGIRAALGADRRRILAGVFSRAAAQVGAGALAGFAGAVALEGGIEGPMFQGHAAVLLPLVAALMTAVGLLATVVPARRGLRVQPIDALREE